MDAVHVLVCRLGKFNLIFLGEIGVAVALRAGERQVHLENRRTEILHRQNLVAAVAVPALRRAGRAHRMTHAVDARGVIFTFFFMTTGAIRWRDILVVLQFRDAVVTVNAIQLAVNRQRKTIRREIADGFLDAVDHPGGGRIGMAVETVGVGQFRGGVRLRGGMAWHNPNQQGRQQNKAGQTGPS